MFSQNVQIVFGWALIPAVLFFGALSSPACAAPHTDQNHTSSEKPADRSSGEESPRAVEWRSIASDLEMGEFSEDESVLRSPLVMLRTTLQRFQLRVLRASEFGLVRAEVRTLCRRSGASVCINANFFDESGAPLGLVVSRGIVRHPLHSGGSTLTGIVQVTRQGVSIISRQHFNEGKVLEAAQAGPRLVSNGSAVTGIRDSERTGRSAICRDRKGRIVFASTGAGFRGLTFIELQRALMHPEIDCLDALNLDGGGSSQLFVAPHASNSSDSAVLVSMNGFDPVPVALALVEE